ncbi:MAG: RtcB family protein [Prevotella sp.]|nr:RtcB family protein [Alistipes senegalensis]MCM1357506.1 RtcB family protein [Prevotella sp.]MCM1472835.1 RtcB family protein [Muribaculaceae bacterium]
MFELTGKYNSAKVFTDIIEQEAISQIINMCSQKAFEGSQVRIMPDVHAGKGCTIGTTMTIKDKVVPNLVGVDIGCGMEVCRLGNEAVDFEKLDNVIRNRVPSGFTIREKRHRFASNVDLKQLRCCEKINETEERAIRSLGTLGGGNHFIEVDVNGDGVHYLVIHSGSRHLGVAVASFYQKEAYRQLSKHFNKEAQNAVITRCKAEGRIQDIQAELKKLTAESVPADFAYCEGQLFEDYVHDMKLVQQYAVWNRKAMLDEILTGMGLSSFGGFTTIHNYLDTENMILRKGAVSAQAGEKLIIPINMRDGSLICTGKGNPDWNFSAPHGAGRIMSRSKAKESISLDEFRESMKGIFTTSVGTGTIDESPMVYKSIDDILDNIGDTVEVNEIIKPVYNFKAGE